MKLIHISLMDRLKAGLKAFKGLNGLKEQGVGCRGNPESVNHEESKVYIKDTTYINNKSQIHENGKKGIFIQ